MSYVERSSPTITEKDLNDDGEIWNRGGSRTLQPSNNSEPIQMWLIESCCFEEWKGLPLYMIIISDECNFVK